MISNDKTVVLCDNEYIFTSCKRENDKMLPSHRNIVGMLDEYFPDNIINFYHVGLKRDKTRLFEFLSKLKIDNIIFECVYASKTQLIGTAMGIDTIKYLDSMAYVKNFVFISGDDYLIPIVDELTERDVNIYIMCFPILMSKELNNVCNENKNINLKFLSNKYFMFQKTVD